MIKDIQNIEELNNLRMAINAVHRGFFIYTAPTARDVSEIARELMDDDPDKFALMDISHVMPEELRYYVLYEFAMNNPNKILLFINPQALADQAIETAIALNMARDSLSALERIWIFGVTEDFRYYIQKNARDFYSYTRLFFTFTDEDTGATNPSEAEQTYAVDFEGDREAVKKALSRLETEVNAQQRHLLINTVLSKYPGLGLEVNEQINGLIDEFAAGIPEVDSILLQAKDYMTLEKAYFYTGNYYQASEAVSKALNIRENILGKEHPDTAEAYNNLALVYQVRGDYEKALDYCWKALTIREKVLGTEHPSTAATYNDLACIYDDWGDYEKALAYNEKTLAIREKTFGVKHLDTAKTYNNLAGVYRARGDYGKAMWYYVKTMAIREKLLGTEHPDTAKSYSSLASVYMARGDYEKAMRYYLDALAIYEKALGKNHPNTVIMRKNIKFFNQQIKDNEQLNEITDKIRKTAFHG